MPQPGLRPLAVLMLEDSALDAELIQACLEDGGLKVDVSRVDAQETFSAALDRARFDVILCDYNVPGFGGTAALAAAHASCPDTPFIFVSGALGEDRAIELLKRGATDYVLKNRLERLVPSVERALREARGASERMRAEAALRESEERYRLATLATADAVWDWDLASHRVQWNDAVQTLFGYSRQETQANPLWWNESVHPEDLERVLRGITDVLETHGQRWQDQFRFRRRDGVYTYVVDRGHVSYDTTGRPVRMVGVMQDVSAQKAVEAVLSRQARLGQLMADVGLALTRGSDRSDMLRLCVEALVRHLDVALARVWLLDEGGTTLVPEASAGSFSPPEPVLGRAPLGSPLLPARIARASSPLVLTSPRELALAMGLEDTPHTERLGGLVGHALRVGDKTLGVVVVVAREALAQASLDSLQHISDSLGLGVERLRAEEETARLFAREKAARTTAEEANRLKDEFLATVSHELRTPLTAMLGWVRLLRIGNLNQDKRERALETVERNARAQAQLIEDLLDVSRIMAGKLLLEVAPLDVPSVVEQALETVRPAAEAKNIQMKLSLEPACRVMGDAHRLQQVAWNLLANAVKFTPAGGRVGVEVAHGDGQVRLTVTDTGEGIAADFLPHVFERFRQADGGSTRRYGGLGLGLSIVRHLVEMHGGSVGVTSPGQGQGATFTVLLPEVSSSRRAGSAAEPDQRALERGPAACPPELVGLHVLVVEDEADTREMVRTLLESCQMRVSAAASVREGLELLTRESPDLLLSDIGMPGEDGYVLIRAVRALPVEAGGRIPAVALTAFARAEDRTRVLLAGFNSHVPKPVEPLELFAVLVSLARRGSRAVPR